MADTVKQTDELRIKCTLRNGAAQTTRTLTVNSPKVYNDTERQRMIDFRDKLMTGSLSGVIQPASWRDDDEEMTPYETAAVEFSTFTSTEITHDLDSGVQPTKGTLTIAGDDYTFYKGEAAVTVTADENFVNPDIVQVSGVKPTASIDVSVNRTGTRTWTIKYSNYSSEPTWQTGVETVLLTVEIEDADKSRYATGKFSSDGTPTPKVVYQLYDL